MTTPRVEYGYASGAHNTIRPTLLTYANGRELTVDYGTAGGMDDQCASGHFHRLQCGDFSHDALPLNGINRHSRGSRK